MLRRPPRSTRTDTLFPSTTLYRFRALHPVEFEHRVDVVFKVAVALDEVGHRHVAVTALALGPGDDDVAANLRVARAPAHEVQQPLAGRSEERRVGNECVSTSRSR